MLYRQIHCASKLFTNGLINRLGWPLLVCAWLLTGIVAAQTSAPDVELQGILSREKIERDEDVTLNIFISNKSSVPIILSRITVLSESTAEKINDFVLPAEVPPFGTIQGKSILSNANNAKFGAHKIVVTADYFWPNNKVNLITTKTVTLPLELTRRFEEEAKGFPGGTAAFLYLLLPVIPAFLSYQIVEQIRNKEKLKMPEFETKHIAPAFLLAIVVSFLMVLGSSSDADINYSDPVVFITVLFVSLVAGAIFSVGKWLWYGYRMWRWGFSPNDLGPDYLRKALLGPRAPEEFKWVTGTVQGETWQGFQLRQPNGALVLGAQVWISTRDQAKKAFRDSKLHDRKLLVWLAKKKKINVGMNEPVTRGTTGDKQFAVMDGLELFESSPGPDKPFIRLIP